MQHRVVSREEWLVARKALLGKEKELTRARDRVSAERRALPWVKVDKVYAFDTTEGRHLFQLRPRRRSPVGCLQLARPDAQGPQRERHHELGAAA
jgi:predicted dithiol-disulfide oxidoreductase (DUF899 family)